MRRYWTTLWLAVCGRKLETYEYAAEWRRVAYQSGYDNGYRYGYQAGSELATRPKFGASQGLGLGDGLPDAFAQGMQYIASQPAADKSGGPENAG